MAGYLDNYGAGEEERIQLIKRLVISVVLIVVTSGILYFFFKNYKQENQAKIFFRMLEQHDYQGAYRLWGCTETSPCRDYPLEKFMEDWGPKSPRADVASYRVRKSRSCGSGVILTVDFGKDQEEKLWVERQDLTIGFSPWPGCPPGR
jgi:hypothetical protein